MKRLAIISAIAFLAFGICAETLSLDQCKQLALQNNASMKIARGNSEVAREVSREAFTKYFPTVGAQWLGFRANKGVFQYTLPSVGELMPFVEQIAPSELQPLVNESLGEIELVKKGWTAGLTAMQPIFAGGRIVNGNKLAHVGEDAALLEQENAQSDVILTTEKYYWQLVALQSKRQTLESVLQMVDTLERQVSVAVQAGVAMRNDLLKVKLRRNELRALMVDLDNGIALSSKLLAQHIGFDDKPIEVAETADAADMPPFPLDLHCDAAVALPATPDYRLLDVAVKAADLQTRMAVGENLPTVGLGAGWFYDDLFNQKHNFAALMLTVSVPITGWWGGSHKIRQQAVAADNARLRLADLSQMLCIGMQNAWDDVTSAYRKMEIARESIAEAQENLRLNQNYYNSGVSTITELLDAQTLYRQSQDQYTEAYGNFRTCCASYRKATAQLH